MDKLKDHSTPGPWQQSRYVSKPEHHRLPMATIDKWSREERVTVRGAGKLGSPECNIVAVVYNDDDRKLIITAPEMRDFIADFLEEMDKISGITPELSTLITRAEEILKKAYNF